ncbi:hypothetical protein [Nocardioides sp. AX2bis]|uniref:hypothetical protein n=1 Tax=Nocardioides sp. AX2bis TaxID=2653157 RepID=UPI0012EF8B9D|nr:hypothetical protein [Nocardioides sp. AX2bis]VXC51916.1 conserved exported hypothetical protein [Nocardioides sp. AX2bis]
MSKNRVSTLATGVLAAICLTTALAGPASADMVGTTEGCTPGYWKNHPQSWLDNPTDTTPVYTPKTPLTVVSPQFAKSLPGETFGGALKGGGGKGLAGATAILARAATAAWLNSTVEIAFPYRRTTTGAGGVEGLRPLVNSALRSGDRAVILELATTLDNANNLGCPLN